MRELLQRDCRPGPSVAVRVPLLCAPYVARLTREHYACDSDAPPRDMIPDPHPRFRLSVQARCLAQTSVFIGIIGTIFSITCLVVDNWQVAEPEIKVGLWRRCDETGCGNCECTMRLSL